MAKEPEPKKEEPEAKEEEKSEAPKSKPKPKAPVKQEWWDSPDGIKKVDVGTVGNAKNPICKVSDD